MNISSPELWVFIFMAAFGLVAGLNLAFWHWMPTLKHWKPGPKTYVLGAGTVLVWGFVALLVTEWNGYHPALWAIGLSYLGLFAVAGGFDVLCYKLDASVERDYNYEQEKTLHEITSQSQSAVGNERSDGKN